MGSREERRSASLVLECEGVKMRFGGLEALGGVDVEVREGEIVGLIGPNGAGKTTLMECISGFRQPSAGKIVYRGEDLLRRRPAERAKIGIGRTLQDVRLFPNLSAVENVCVALNQEQRSGTIANVLGMRSARAERRNTVEKARQILSDVGMEAFGENLASELSYGMLRLLELACVTALSPSVLLLDEPSAGLSHKETEELGPILRDMKEKTGASCLIIEHDMPLIMSLSDWMYCLDSGQVISSGTTTSVQRDEAVERVYLGTGGSTTGSASDIDMEKRRSEGAADKCESALLASEELEVLFGRIQVLSGVTFRINRGERIALLGTNGAGKSTLLRAVAGLVRASGGQVEWKGRDVTGAQPEELVREGMGLVLGGRGIFPTLTVAENVWMGGFKYKDEGRVNYETKRVLGYFPWLQERSEQLAGSLSGGEQQQLAIARALVGRPELLLVDELSLGLAPVAVKALMRVLVKIQEEEEIAVVAVEQQPGLILEWADRAYFLEKGEVQYEGSGSELAGRSDLLRSVFLAGGAVTFGGGPK